MVRKSHIFILREKKKNRKKKTKTRKSSKAAGVYILCFIQSLGKNQQRVSETPVLRTISVTV